MPGEVQRWLFRMKQALADRTAFVLWERGKNRETLLNLGFDRESLRLQLLELTSADRIWGPGPDDDPDRQGDVTVFAPLVGEPAVEIYVKVKVVTDASGRVRVECLSFHYPDRPLRQG